MKNLKILFSFIILLIFGNINFINIVSGEQYEAENYYDLTLYPNEEGGNIVNEYQLSDPNNNTINGIGTFTGMYQLGTANYLDYVSQSYEFLFEGQNTTSSIKALFESGAGNVLGSSSEVGDRNKQNGIIFLFYSNGDSNFQPFQKQSGNSELLNGYILSKFLLNEENGENGSFAINETQLNSDYFLAKSEANLFKNENGFKAASVLLQNGTKVVALRINPNYFQNLGFNANGLGNKAVEFLNGSEITQKLLSTSNPGKQKISLDIFWDCDTNGNGVKDNQDKCQNGSGSLGTALRFKLFTTGRDLLLQPRSSGTTIIDEVEFFGNTIITPSKSSNFLQSLFPDFSLKYENFEDIAGHTFNNTHSTLINGNYNNGTISEDTCFFNYSLDNQIELDKSSEDYQGLDKVTPLGGSQYCGASNFFKTLNWVNFQPISSSDDTQSIIINTEEIIQKVLEKSEKGENNGYFFTPSFEFGDADADNADTAASAFPKKFVYWTLETLDGEVLLVAAPERSSSYPLTQTHADKTVTNGIFQIEGVTGELGMNVYEFNPKFATEPIKISDFFLTPYVANANDSTGASICDNVNLESPASELQNCIQNWIISAGTINDWSDFKNDRSFAFYKIDLYKLFFGNPSDVETLKTNLNTLKEDFPQLVLKYHGLDPSNGVAIASTVSLGAGNLPAPQFPSMDVKRVYSDFPVVPEHAGSNLEKDELETVAQSLWNSTSLRNDSDNDNLPDAWEQAHFGSLDFNEDDDPDEDGIVNIEEFESLTNPNQNPDYNGALTNGINSSQAHTNTTVFKLRNDSDLVGPNDLIIFADEDTSFMPLIFEHPDLKSNWADSNSSDACESSNDEDFVNCIGQGGTVKISEDQMTEILEKTTGYASLYSSSVECFEGNRTDDPNIPYYWSCKINRRDPSEINFANIDPKYENASYNYLLTHNVLELRQNNSPFLTPSNPPILEDVFVILKQRVTLDDLEAKASFQIAENALKTIDIEDNIFARIGEDDLENPLFLQLFEDYWSSKTSRWIDADTEIENLENQMLTSLRFPFKATSFVRNATYDFNLVEDYNDCDLESERISLTGCVNPKLINNQYYSYRTPLNSIRQNIEVDVTWEEEEATFLDESGNPTNINPLDPPSWTPPSDVRVFPKIVNTGDQDICNLRLTPRYADNGTLSSLHSTLNGLNGNRNTEVAVTSPSGSLSPGESIAFNEGNFNQIGDAFDEEGFYLSYNISDANTNSLWYTLTYTDCDGNEREEDSPTLNFPTCSEGTCEGDDLGETAVCEIIPTPADNSPVSRGGQLSYNIRVENNGNSLNQTMVDTKLIFPTPTYSTKTGGTFSENDEYVLGNIGPSGDNTNNPVRLYFKVNENSPNGGVIRTQASIEFTNLENSQTYNAVCNVVENPISSDRDFLTITATTGRCPNDNNLADENRVPDNACTVYQEGNVNSNNHTEACITINYFRISEDESLTDTPYGTTQYPELGYGEGCIPTNDRNDLNRRQRGNGVSYSGRNEFCSFMSSPSDRRQTNDSRTTRVYRNHRITADGYKELSQRGKYEDINVGFNITLPESMNVTNTYYGFSNYQLGNTFATVSKNGFNTPISGLKNGTFDLGLRTTSSDNEASVIGDSLQQAMWNENKNYTNLTTPFASLRFTVEASDLKTSSIEGVDNFDNEIQNILSSISASAGIEYDYERWYVEDRGRYRYTRSSSSGRTRYYDWDPNRRERRQATLSNQTFQPTDPVSYPVCVAEPGAWIQALGGGVHSNETIDFSQNAHPTTSENFDWFATTPGDIQNFTGYNDSVQQTDVFFHWRDPELCNDFVGKGEEAANGNITYFTEPYEPDQNGYCLNGTKPWFQALRDGEYGELYFVDDQGFSPNDAGNYFRDGFDFNIDPNDPNRIDEPDKIWYYSSYLNRGSDLQSEYTQVYRSGREQALENLEAGALLFGHPDTDVLELRGRGTLFVEGDLYIGSNLNYSSDGQILTDIRENERLPAAGFIVNGDLYVDPAVEQVVGLYYVKGTVHTGESTRPLRVIGSMVANRFEFERRADTTYDPNLDLTITGNDKPSEVYLWDPRFDLVLPPGFVDQPVEQLEKYYTAPNDVQIDCKLYGVNCARVEE